MQPHAILQDNGTTIPSPRAIFQVCEVTKVYHMGEVEVRALRSIDLDLYEGEFVVLLGPSGSGKSTLLNILGGLDVPSSGQVFFRDRDLTAADDAALTRFRRQCVGFVFQFYNLIPSLTARENVALVTEIATAPMRPEEALELVGLGARLDHFPAQLSGGEQQRVAIARAVALPPAEAMRPEPPARFRRTVLEQLGMQRLLSPVGRMILRNLERQPLQTGLSILGLAMAVAILILGGYFEDAVQYLMEVQFRHVQREDITVVFNEPLSAGARYEVSNLPGVRGAESFRTVVARLRFGHRTHRTALTGLDPGGEFRRLVDRHLRAVALPPEGVVLTTKLAEILGIAPGEPLMVEVLEGTRPTRQVVVVGLVDELVGTSAYMDIAALNRLMHEGQTISGAYLAVDPYHATTLYALLKRLPAVAGASFRKAAFDSFENTVAESLRVFVRVLVVFACIITFSVVYNAARIALSERGWELAGLRVLGFTRAEIAVILLGEQATLTLAALPLGFMLGYWFCTLMPLAYDSELYRMPVVVTRGTYAFAFVVVAVAALISGLIVRRRLDHLDLIAVLKTRE